MTGARRISRPRWLNARTVAGAVLLAVSFISSQRVLADARAGTPVWTAQHDLGAGARITSQDFEVTSVRLPPEVLNAYVPSSIDVQGAVLGQAVREGELLPADAVEDHATDEDTRLMTIPVGEEHLPIADARPGDGADVFATFEDGTRRPRTELLLADVEIVRLHESGSVQLGASNIVGVTVAVRAADARRLSFAIQMGSLDLALIPRREGAQPPPERAAR